MVGWHNSRIESLQVLLTFDLDLDLDLDCDNIALQPSCGQQRTWSYQKSWIREILANTCIYMSPPLQQQTIIHVVTFPPMLLMLLVNSITLVNQYQYYVWTIQSCQQTLQTIQKLCSGSNHVCWVVKGRFQNKLRHNGTFHERGKVKIFL